MSPELFRTLRDFVGNSALYGGGIYNSTGSDPEVTNCTFTENSATMGAGGLINDTNCSPVLTNCLFRGNTAGDEGGAIMHQASGNFWLNNCTFTGNDGAGNGDAIYVLDATVTLNNCVLWGDGAPLAGLGEEIFLSGQSGNVSFANVDYSDVEGGELQVEEGGDSEVTWGVGNLDVDPKFVDPDGPDDDPDTFGDNNYRLDTGSPAIDAADNNAVTVCSADLDGNERFFDDPATDGTGNGVEPFIDMGAYEFDSDPALDCNNNQIADSCCPADADGDGGVGPFDLASLLGAWGDCPTPCTTGEASCTCPADFNNDCDVGASDLPSLLAAWGACP